MDFRRLSSIPNDVHGFPQKIPLMFVNVHGFRRDAGEGCGGAVVHNFRVYSNNTERKGGPSASWPSQFGHGKGQERQHVVISFLTLRKLFSVGRQQSQSGIDRSAWPEPGLKIEECCVQEVRVVGCPSPLCVPLWTVQKRWLSAFGRWMRVLL